MRTENEILLEYEQEYQKYDEVEKTERYIERINYLIRGAIRALDPCYPGTTKYIRAEIYPRDARYFDSDCIEERYKGLYALWYKAPYQYEIPDADKVRINGILQENFTLDKFKGVKDLTTMVKKEWREIEQRLLDEYGSIQTDMTLAQLLNAYCSEDYGLHPLKAKFIKKRCKLTMEVSGAGAV